MQQADRPGLFNVGRPSCIVADHTVHTNRSRLRTLAGDEMTELTQSAVTIVLENDEQ